VATNVATEGYSVPPNAVQKAGPIPLGNLLGATLPSPLASDFDAVQQTVYASGDGSVAPSKLPSGIGPAFWTAFGGTL